jgi:hypothetical protein
MVMAHEPVSRDNGTMLYRSLSSLPDTPEYSMNALCYFILRKEKIMGPYGFMMPLTHQKTGLNLLSHRSGTVVGNTLTALYAILC